MISALLLLLICTLIGYLLGRPELGLIIGIVLLILVAWANWPHVH